MLIKAFSIRQDDIVHALILALDDKCPDVVNASMISLARFGIDNSEKLKNKMIELGILPRPYDLCAQSNRLDVLLAIFQAKNRNDGDKAEIKAWYESVS